MAAFMKVQQSSEISGSVSVLHGAGFQSFRIGAEVYHVGVLPWWTRVNLWFMEYLCGRGCRLPAVFPAGHLGKAMVARQGAGTAEDG